MKNLRRRSRYAYLHVVFSTELQKPLQTGGRVLGTLSLVSMRQQHHDATETSPFGFAASNELVDDDLYVYESPGFYERLRSAILRESSDQNFFNAAYESFKNESNYKIIENFDQSLIEGSDKNSELLISELNIGNNSITFKTNKPNQLHLIKVSYFPNWKKT